MTGSLKAHLFVVALISMALIGLFVSVQSFDVDRAGRVHDLLGDMEQADALSEQGLLEIYNHQLFHFDNIIAVMAQLNKSHQLLQSLLADTALFSGGLKALSDSLRIQQDAVRRFESSFGVLSNSIRYLPTLTAQIVRERPELQVQLLRLNRNVFYWHLFPDHTSVLAELRQQQALIEKMGLQELSRHIDVILTYGTRAVDAINQATHCGTPENIHLLSAAFDQDYASRVKRNNSSRMALILLSVLLLVYLLLLLVLKQRSAASLAASEKRFRLLFDLIPDGVGIHRDGLWVYCNPAALRLFGAASASQLIGTPVLDRVHPEMRPEVIRRLRVAAEQGHQAPLMLQRNLRLDGSEFYGEVQGIPFSEADDDSQMMTVVRDVSGRIQAEDESRRLVAILEQTSDFVGMADREGHTIYINPAGLAMLGYAADTQYVNRMIADFHPDDEHERLFNYIFPTVESTGSMQVECMFLHRDGHEIPTSAVFTVHKNSVGDVTHYSVIARDLTEDRKRSKQLEHTQRLESLGILAGGIAHDFNNILTAIMGNAAMAGRQMPAASPAREFLSRIEDGSQRAAELCKQMLAYSGKGKFVVKPVDLSGLVAEMTRLMEVSIQKNVVLKYHLAGNLPVVEADEAQLQQVILNLITNANEAIGSNSGVISFSTGVMHVDSAYLEQTVSSEKLREGRYVYVEVSDTGCGMNSDTIQKIFDPFFTTKFTGRGLGMSAVLGIVRGHHGALRVYSEPGKGTTFKMLLPASDQQAAALEQTHEAGEQWQFEGTVLVVDDEETIREVATMMLEDIGFSVLTAENGLDALAVYRRHQQEITGVLMDMTMPKMDGKECFRELRRINADVKVILSSGYNEQDATSRFVGQGLSGFIQKPYSPEALLAIVKEVWGEQHGHA